MKRGAWIVAIVSLLLLFPFAAAANGEEGGGVGIAFGFGGPMVGLFLPDLSGMNAFLEENGFAALTDPFIVPGGGGRGGAGSFSIGGMGWGGEVCSRREAPVEPVRIVPTLGVDIIPSPPAIREATLSIGFGGVDLGYVVKGSERSLLTVGAVLGGGGLNLNLREVAAEEETCPASRPQGIVIEPTGVDFGRAFLGVLPYVSLEVHPFGWVGFDLHLGYLLPLLGFDWSSEEGVTGPSLNLSGPFVGFSVAFGGIVRLEWGPYRYNETTQTSIDLGTRTTVLIKNGIGNVTVAMQSTVQTGAARRVELVAVKQARSEETLRALAINVVETEQGIEIRSEAPGRSATGWGVDYFVKVPPGTALDVEQGVGDVTLTDYTGPVVVKVGVGKVMIERLTAPEVRIDVGVGDVSLAALESAAGEVSVGTGSIDIGLRPDASLAVKASAGLGGVSIADFPGMQVSVKGMIGHEVRAVLGGGAGSLTLSVGIGDIRVRPIGVQPM